MSFTSRHRRDGGPWVYRSRVEEKRLGLHGWVSFGFFSGSLFVLSPGHFWYCPFPGPDDQRKVLFVCRLLGYPEWRRNQQTIRRTEEREGEAMNEREKEIWEDLYLASRRLWKEAPWEDYTNSDPLHIEIPGHGDAYVIILGNGRQQYGLSVSLGPTARENMIRRFCCMNPELHAWPMDTASCQDSLVVDFDGWAEMEGELEEQGILRRELGAEAMFPRNRIPYYTHYLPYRQPRAMTTQEAAVLTAAIQEVLRAVRVMDPPLLPYHLLDIDIYHYNRRDQTWRVEHLEMNENTLPVLDRGSIPEEEIEELKKAKRVPLTIEMEAAVTERQLESEECIEYLRLCAISVVGGGVYESLIVYHQESMGQKMVELLSRFCREAGIPKEILVRNRESAERIASLTVPLGIKVSVADLDGPEHKGWKIVKSVESDEDTDDVLAHLEEVLVAAGVYSEKELQRLRQRLGEQGYKDYIAERFEKLAEESGLNEWFRQHSLGLD